MTPIVRLGDVVNINPRGTPNLNLTDNIAFVAMADVTEDGELHTSRARSYGEVSVGYTPFQNGDVLLAKITPCFENGKSCLVSGMSLQYGFGSTEFHVLRAGSNIDSKFLHHLVRSSKFRQEGQSRMTGSAGQKRVPKAFIEDFQVSLPPKNDQRRIAAILDKAEVIRNKRRKVLKLADEFLRSVFLDMFGDLFSETNNKWQKLSDCTDFIDYRGKTPEKSDSGVRLITAKNVRDGVINIEPAEFISEETYSWWMSRGFPRSGDVLFTTEAPLGNVAVLNTQEPVAIGQRLIAIRPREMLRWDYLSWALRQSIVQSDILSRSTGSTVKGIRSAELVQVQIPIPGKVDQLKFEKIVASINHQKSSMQVSAQQGDLLFQSLQHHAFQGNL